MPGEDAESALLAAENLQQSRIGTVFTLLGENTENLEEAEGTVGHYQALLEDIRERDLNSEISVKLTQLGLDLSPDVAFQNLEKLVKKTKELDGGIVWIDMEESRYVDRTLDLFRRLLKNHDNVGLCLQAYLYRTEQDLKSLLPLTSSIRLVKGAYAEPKEIAFPRKRDVDQNYFCLALQMLKYASPDDGRQPAFATHDQSLIQTLKQTVLEKKINPSAFEFQMLYGIRPSAQKELVEEDYRLRVLISYGKEWFPWYMRRLAERPANLWFVAKNIWRS